MSNTIMLCLEKIGIGGIETLTLNQTLEYKKLGYNVIVLAKEGIYAKYLKENNITFIPFEFSLEDNFNLEKSMEIVKIINEYHVDEIVINQFPCILSILPACYATSTPYIAYVHTSISVLKNDEFNVFDWYERTFSLYKFLFKLYFKNAKKVVAITERAADYVKNRYDIDENKIEVIHNSINLEAYKTNNANKTNKKEKFLIISRLADEKLQSIKNGIELFRKYPNANKTLSIVGDGDKLEELKKYVENDKNISFLGARNDIKEIIDEHDIILGLDRTILEAITMKKIAIISGYDKLKQIVTKDNIEIESKEGFSGESLKDNDIDTLIKQIKNNKIDVEYNYNFVKENLNIEKNIYRSKEAYDVNYDVRDLFELINKLQNESKNELKKQECEKNEKIEYLQGQIQKSNNQLENEMEKIKAEDNNIKQQLEMTQKELNSVYSSKRYKLSNMIAKIIGH